MPIESCLWIPLGILFMAPLQSSSPPCSWTFLHSSCKPFSTAPRGFFFVDSSGLILHRAHGLLSTNPPQTSLHDTHVDLYLWHLHILNVGYLHVLLVWLVYVIPLFPNGTSGIHLKFPIFFLYFALYKILIWQ